MSPGSSTGKAFGAPNISMQPDDEYHGWLSSRNRQKRTNNRSKPGTL
jgi:hypothetical protein